MSAPAWMPLYVADYLADTGHLSTIEHGAYMLLIMHYWQNGGLPVDDARLARICRMTPKEWRASRDVLAAFFDDQWRHKRVDEEIAAANETMNKRSEAGKRAVAARESKRQRNDDKSHIDQSSNDDRSDIESISPPPSPPPKKGSVAKATAPPAEWSDDRSNLFGGALQWLIKQTGKPPAQSRKIIGHWLKLTGDDAAAVLGLVRQARDRNLADPVAWIEAALKPKPAGEQRESTWPERAEIYRRTGVFLGEWGTIDDVPAEHAHLFGEASPEAAE